MLTPGVVARRSIPDPKDIATLLTLSNTGDTNPVTAGGVGVTNFYNDNNVPWHEGLLKIEVFTTGGKGGTPTAVGVGKTLTLWYAFSDTKLNATADAPTILTTAAKSLSCALPNAVSTQASGSLTFTGVPGNGQQAFVGLLAGGRKAYTFVTTLSGAANEVKIGASAAATATNFIAAVNAGAGAGTTYGTGTVAHPDVVASSGGSGVATLTANNYDTSGNSITTTLGVFSNASWGNSTLTGGTASGTALFATGAFVHLGRYLYVWYDRLAFDDANALIDVSARLVRL